MVDRVVGWICDEEWICCYQNLFYGSLSDQYYALDIINLWRARFCGKIPVAIDATSRLLESWLEGSKVSSDAKRQLMSSAITQFVGLVTEKGLKGNTKKPIHEVGEDFGIPEWLINLRHEMAHGPLPSLQMLEKAVVFALDWLKDNHWDAQHAVATKCKKPKKTQTTKASTPIPTNEYFLQLLLEYVDVMLRKFNHAYTPRKKKKASVLLQDIDSCTQSEVDARQLCHILVQHKFLVTHPRNFVKSLSIDVESKSQYFKFWKRLFEIICDRQQQFGFLHELVKEMCKQPHGNNAHSILCTWVDHVMDSVGSDKISIQIDAAGKVELLRMIAMLVNSKCVCATDLLNKIEEKLPQITNCSEAVLLKELHKCSGKETPQKNQVVTIDSTNGTEISHLNKFCNFDEISITPTVVGPWKVYNGKCLNQIGQLNGQSLQTLHKSLLKVSTNQEEVKEKNETNCEQVEMIYDDNEVNNGTNLKETNQKTGLSTLTDANWFCLEKMVIGVDV